MYRCGGRPAARRAPDQWTAGGRRAGNPARGRVRGRLPAEGAGRRSSRHRPLAGLIGESRESRTQLAKLGALTAGEAMTAPALTIPSSRRIVDAAALMTARGVNRLPVVDAGRLVGIVTGRSRSGLRSDRRRARRDDPPGRPPEDPLARPDPVHGGREGRCRVGQRRVERRSTAEMIESSARTSPASWTSRPT